MFVLVIEGAGGGGQFKNIIQARHHNIFLRYYLDSAENSNLITHIPNFEKEQS